jgi:hypothetical protein
MKRKTKQGREELENLKPKQQEGSAILYSLKPSQNALMQGAFDSDHVPENFLLERKLPSR